MVILVTAAITAAVAVAIAAAMMIVAHKNAFKTRALPRESPSPTQRTLLTVVAFTEREIWTILWGNMDVRVGSIAIAARLF